MHRVADDGADDAGGDVDRPELAVTEMGGQGQPVGDHRDRLGRGQRATGDLQARPLIGGAPGAHSRNIVDNAFDFLGGGGHGRQIEGARRARRPDA